MKREEIFNRFPAIEKMGDYENSCIKVYELDINYVKNKYHNTFTLSENNYYDEFVKIVAVLKDGKMLNDILIGEYFRNDDIEKTSLGETLGAYIIRKNIVNDLDYFIVQRRGHSTLINITWNEISIFYSNPNFAKIIEILPNEFYKDE